MILLVKRTCSEKHKMNPRQPKNKMNDNSHEPDPDRRSFLLKVMAGGSILLGFLLTALLNWMIRKTEELRKKSKLERYKTSPIISV